MTGRLPPPPWAGLLGTAAVATVSVPAIRPAMLVLAGAVVGWYRPRWGVLFWAATTSTLMFAVYQAGHAAIYPGPLLLGLFLSFLAFRLYSGGAAWKAMESELTAPLLLLGGVAIVSGFQGSFFYDASVPGVHRSILVQSYAVVLVLLSVGAAFLVGSEIESEASLRLLVLAVVAASLLIVSRGIIVLLPRTPWWVLVGSLGTTLLYSRLVCDPPRAFWQRALAAGCIIYLLVEAVGVPFYLPAGPQWVSGWLMLGTSLAMATLLAFPRLFFILVLPATVVVLAFSIPMVHRAIELAESEGDFLRFEIWVDAFRIMAVKPLLGVGPGNYLDYAIRYAHGGTLFGSAHGNYQQIAAEMGILGLVAMAWLFFRTARLIRRLLRTVTSPFYRSVVVGAAAGLSGQAVASLIGDYLIPAYHNGGHTNICSTIYNWILLGMLMATERLTRRQTT